MKKHPARSALLGERHSRAMLLVCATLIGCGGGLEPAVDEVSSSTQALSPTPTPDSCRANGICHQACAKTLVTTNDNAGCLNYWYRLPATYNPAKPGGYPVIMYLHGSGQRGDGSALDTNYTKITTDGPLREVKDGRWQVSGVDRHDAILIAPQTPTSRSGDNHPAHPANGQQSLH
ncbi:MAG: hypothetical protein JNG84_00885, partial [Archangium sp.]|nr:hypothetical protein [Archangium sp.]